jgi:hypothetical protein
VHIFLLMVSITTDNIKCSKILETTVQTMLFCNPGDHNLNFHCCEHPKSHTRLKIRLSYVYYIILTYYQSSLLCTATMGKGEVVLPAPIELLPVIPAIRLPNLVLYLYSQPVQIQTGMSICLTLHELTLHNTLTISWLANYQLLEKVLFLQ